MASQIPITIRAQPTAASSAALRGKKRAGSPAVSAVQQATGSGSKKKKAPQTATPTAQTQMTVVETVSEVKPAGSVDSGPTATTESTAKPPPFKDPSFMHSGIGGAAAGKKNRTWKNLKQILALERTLPWKLNDPNYYNIDAPPSLKPAKKYSDISGLPANYTDPQTKLRFTSSEEFSYIRLLPTDVVTGYLALRKATCIVP
ncbi:INO80 complex subunit C [Seriola lalandi dorsalis]|uniref:INO80 complex subunit C n=1 Tax=Seriola lalandi dorsalis TaxID=1841481 RepID=A0A3B4XU53_SERLL|nr:INO80 complex subunit C [Seriola lalandi dorsalis]XP_056236835.1 INO80 complex subunit C [Seriola aureovittata]